MQARRRKRVNVLANRAVQVWVAGGQTSGGKTLAQGLQVFHRGGDFDLQQSACCVAALNERQHLTGPGAGGTFVEAAHLSIVAALNVPPPF